MLYKIRGCQDICVSDCFINKKILQSVLEVLKLLESGQSKTTSVIIIGDIDKILAAI